MISQIILVTFYFYMFECICKFSLKDLKNRNITKISERLTSSVHAIPAYILSTFVLLDKEIWNNHLTYVSPLSGTMITFTCGYFLYDVFNILFYFKKEKIPFLIHGLICFIVYFTAHQYHILHFYGSLFLQWEMSTFFVNNRVITKELGLTGNFVIINDLFLISTFFLSRIIGGVYDIYLFLNDLIYINTNETSIPTSIPIIKPSMNVFVFLLFTMYSLNWKWFLIMLSKVRILLNSRIHS